MILLVFIRLAGRRNEPLPTFDSFAGWASLLKNRLVLSSGSVNLNKFTPVRCYGVQLRVEIDQSSRVAFTG
jgi:hypothetical protein